MSAAALVASALLAASGARGGGEPDNEYEPFPAEWASPAEVSAPASSAPEARAEEPAEVSGAAEPGPFAPSRVEVGPQLRWEATLGVSLLEQASRERASTPVLGAGFSLRPTSPLRFDTAWLFTFVQSGTEQLHVLNTVNALRVRLHYAHPLGGAWWTVGGGPVGYLVTTSQRVPGAATETSVKPAAGAALALGLETVAVGRLFRFEAGAQSRGWRIDGLLSMTVGF